MTEACRKHGIELHIPKTAYSTDNAAMIATMADLMVKRGRARQNRYDVAPFARFIPPTPVLR
jgi:N6-L-threonylcarbamoyladenine synthase